MNHAQMIYVGENDNRLKKGKTFKKLFITKMTELKDALYNPNALENLKGVL